MDVNTTAYNTGSTSGGLFNHPALLYGIRELQAVGDYDGFIHGKHFMVCPDFEPDSDYERQYAINFDAAGGSGYDIPGPYGVATDPATANSNPTFYWRPNQPWTVGNCGYALGAKTSRFLPNQFLVVENMWEEFYPQGGHGDTGTNKGGTVVLNTNGSNKYSWGGASPNELTFRHLNYKKANLLFFDFHVEPLTPKDDVNSQDRLWIDFGT